VLADIPRKKRDGADAALLDRPELGLRFVGSAGRVF